MPLQVGQRLGDYEVQQMLGVGGMGHVYRVRNVISNRTEAMKVLLPDLTAEPDLAKRFLSEIRTLASFDHPNIAQLHTALVAENQLIMMMEYVEGYTLEQMAKQRNMPVGEVAGYISQALSALSYAHGRGVVHRDVKPANLMVTSHGIVKLMDFGIAKSNVENSNYTRPGTTLGSLYYMSPEQVRGGTVDARSDIYSVGIVLYELLAGRRPFEADTTFTILNKHLNEPPQPPVELNPEIPAGLNAIILIALAKDAEQRFQNADAFRNALKSFCTAPGENQVPAPVAAAAAVAAPVAAAAPIPAAAASATAAFAPVAMPAYAASTPATATSFGSPAASYAPAAQAPAYAAPPAYSQMPQAAAASTPAKPPRSNKPLWIATGAVAAVLALVALAIAGPHWMKTNAAGHVDSQPQQQPPTTVADQSPQPQPPTTVAEQPAQQQLPTASPGQALPSTPPAAPIQRAMNRPASPGPSPQVAQVRASANPAPTQAVVAPPPAVAPPPPNREEMEQAQERMVDMNARASTAKNQVAQIRRQMEATGLGLRGDVESAESRLDTYLRAANSDLQRGNATAATQDLNKAEPELKTLEKFLGH